MADPQPAKIKKPATASRTPREIDLRDLVGADREIAILHGGERYRLRVTTNNKLILTK